MLSDNKPRWDIPSFTWTFLSSGVRLDPSHPSRLQQAGSSLPYRLHRLQTNHSVVCPAVLFHPMGRDNPRREGRDSFYVRLQSPWRNEELSAWRWLTPGFCLMKCVGFFFPVTFQSDLPSFNLTFWFFEWGKMAFDQTTHIPCLSKKTLD